MLLSSRPYVHSRRPRTAGGTPDMRSCGTHVAPAHIPLPRRPLASRPTRAHGPTSRDRAPRSLSTARGSAESVRAGARTIASDRARQAPEDVPEHAVRDPRRRYRTCSQRLPAACTDLYRITCMEYIYTCTVHYVMHTVQYMYCMRVRSPPATRLACSKIATRGRAVVNTAPESVRSVAGRETKPGVKIDPKRKKSVMC